MKRHLLSLALVLSMLGVGVGCTSNTAAVNTLRKDVEARLDKIEARLDASPQPTPTLQPIVLSKVNKTTVELQGGGLRTPYCLTYRIADVTQEVCKDAFQSPPGQVDAFNTERVRIQDCWTSAKVGDPLPVCWR